MTNYYEILGLQPGADSGEIKAAFRRLAKQYHPDKNPNGKDFFERLLTAYETLSDPQLKRNVRQTAAQMQRISATMLSTSADSVHSTVHAGFSVVTSAFTIPTTTPGTTISSYNGAVTRGPLQTIMNYSVNATGNTSPQSTVLTYTLVVN